MHRIEWVVGPLALLRITFPPEANGSKWADARWSHFLRIDPRHPAFRNSHLWPVSPAQLLQELGDHEGGRRHHYPQHEHSQAWLPIPLGFEDHRGFEPNDFISMRLCDGNRNTVGEHFGMVFSSRPKPKPKGATDQRNRYDMPGEVRIWTLRKNVEDIDTIAAIAAEHYGDVLEISDCIVLKLALSLRTVASWSASTGTCPHLFAAATGDETALQARLTPNTPLQTWLKDAVSAPPDPPPAHCTTQQTLCSLYRAMLAPVAILFGPPGTGKTFTSNLFVTAASTGAAEIDRKSDRASTVRILHCAWTNQSLRVMLERFCATPGQKASKVILVVDSLHIRADRDGLPPGVRTMTLLPAAFADWESLWAESLTTPVHVFVTVGKASAVVCDYSTPIWTWMGRFCLCHVDEATQVLRSNSLHLFRFLTKHGKLLLSGDTFQLSAYCTAKWASESLMRIMMVAVSPVMLHVQYRQTPVLGCLTSGLFYEGRLENATTVPESSEKEFLVVLWWCSKDEDQGDGTIPLN